MRTGVAPFKTFLVLLVVLPIVGGCAHPRAASRLAVYAAGSGPDVPKMAAQLSAFEPELSVELSSTDGGPRWTCPGTAAPMNGCSCDLDQMCVLFIDNREPISQDSDEWARVLECLSPTEKPWKIVFLSKPIFPTGPSRIDRKQLPLAELLAREEVRLAFTPEEGPCVRTARIGPTLRQSVQYVSLPLSSAPVSGPAPSWVSRTVSQPCLGLLTADDRLLRWRVTGPEGTLLDELDISANAAGGYAPKFFSISELLAIEREMHGGESEAPTEEQAR